jgi:hypothetical protein
MSRIIVPLHLANLAQIPSGADTGFKKLYLRANWMKLHDGISETDLVLDRPLDNFTPTVGTITALDTVLTALEKLQYSISSIPPPNVTLQDAVNNGNGISNYGGIGYADIVSTNFTNNRTLYLNNNSFATIKIVDNLNSSHSLTIDLDTININGTSYNWSTIVSGGSQDLQQVTDNGSVTTNGITVGSIIAGNFYADGYSFGISDNFDTNYNLSYIPYVGLILDDFAGNQSILSPFGLQLNAGILSYTGPSVSWNLPSASGIIALTSDITTALAGYATESWVGSNYYPLSTNPAGYLTSTSANLLYYPLVANPAGYLTSSALAPYLTTAAAALTYYPIPTGTTAQYIRGDGTLATFPTISTPTLQNVTTAGNATTNPIRIGGGTMPGDTTMDLSQDIQITVLDSVGGYSNIAWLSPISGLILKTNSSASFFSANLKSDLITGTEKNFQFPNNSGTLALTSDIPTGALPAGGTVGQILTKVDATDYNATWQENYADWTSVVKHTVKNNGSGLITKGTPVYVTSSNGTNMLVGKASNTSEATSSKTMGLMQSDITTTGGTQTGFVVTEGLLGGLNTAGTTAGDPVWLGVNGALIYGLINKPYAPAHLVFIGIVTKVSAGNGEIFVKVQNGFELKEIHDVDLITTTPSNGEVLSYESSSSLWKNKTIIEDSITDGVTDKAPSQNSVFDALALKQNLLSYTPFKYVNTTQTTYTGAGIGLSETTIGSTVIPADTFNANDLFKLYYKVSKPITAFGVTMRVKVSTTNNLATATQMSILSLGTAATYGYIGRNNNLTGGIMYCYNVNSSVAFDIAATNTVGGSVPYNTSADLYVFFTIQLGSVLDSVTFQMAAITN